MKVVFRSAMDRGRGDIDNTAKSALTHRLNDSGSAEEDTVDVYIHDPLPLCRRYFIKRPFGQVREDRSVVDQHVNAAELRRYGRHHRIHGLFLRDVDPQWQCLAT